MPEDPGRSLEERVSALESTVARLEAALARPRGAPFSPGRPPAARGRARKPGRQVPPQLKDVRYWFRILGIGLLLLGTVFIFKYSHDESRTIMALRVAVGVAMGLGLIAIGYRMRHSEPHFGSVLSGGGIAIWYITGFAAFQLFDLVAVLPAFAFMTLVTLFAFALAIRQGVVALSVIGAIGGLGTPWLLYETDRALAGPVAYMCLVLAGTIAVYIRQHWKPLLWGSAAVAGGAFVALGAQYYVEEGLPHERMTLQIGLAVYWALYAIAPAWLEQRAPATIAGPGAKLKTIGDIPMFVTLIAIYGVGMTMATWEPDLRIGGWVGVLGSLAYVAAWRRLDTVPERRPLATAHLLSALILLTAGFAALLDGEILLTTIAAEAAALHALAPRTRGRLLPLWAHLLFFAASFAVLGRLIVENTTGLPVFNAEALTNLWVIVSGTAVSFVMTSQRERLVYRYSAHGLILLWILRELHDLPNGQGVVSAVWGAYAIVLVIAGLKLNSSKLRVIGLATLVVTVLKLVIIDLSEIKTIWRVLLFSIFGVVLLALSHWAARFGDSSSPVPGASARPGGADD